MYEKKHYKYYDVCNNCGKQGHTFKQCKNPITSYGVIVFRITPANVRQYLMIRRKDTLGYIDFMRGKYSVSNQKYILNMLKQMTVQEKEKLKKHNFDVLWKDLWKEDMLKTATPKIAYNEARNMTENDVSDTPLMDSPSSIYQTYKQEEINSREKFHYLMNNKIKDVLPQLNLSSSSLSVDQSILHYLVELSNQSEGILNEDSSSDDGGQVGESGDNRHPDAIMERFGVWNEPEWGFPKGRRNFQEKDYDCALREMTEETGYSIHCVKNIKNILPFDEIFLGSNYKSYKHKYYLMYMSYQDSLLIEKYDKSEVSSMQWKTYDECMQCIRPYNLEKKRLITNIEHTLSRYRLKGV